MQAEYPLTATHVCEFDFGPLEVAYEIFDRIKKSLTRRPCRRAPKRCGLSANCCRWRSDTHRRVASRFSTADAKTNPLAKKLGIRELWIKNDTVNYPTLSFQRTR